MGIFCYHFRMTPAEYRNLTLRERAAMIEALSGDSDDEDDE